VKDPLGLELDAMIEDADWLLKGENPVPDANASLGLRGAVKPHRGRCTCSPCARARITDPVHPRAELDMPHGDTCSCEACRLIHRLPDESGGWSVDQ
jgi:hypothetical protein